VLGRFADLPALLLHARLDLLVWNALAPALLGDLVVLAPEGPAGRGAGSSAETGSVRSGRASPTNRSSGIAWIEVEAGLLPRRPTVVVGQRHPLDESGVPGGCAGP
jgi:hypothetical protein